MGLHGLCEVAHHSFRLKLNRLSFTERLGVEVLIAFVPNPPHPNLGSTCSNSHDVQISDHLTEL
jgi:hypothetical protein